MDLTNKDFLLGAIAVSRNDIDVECIARGNYESVAYTWFRLFDSASQTCAVILVDTEDELQISASETFEWDGIKKFTERFLATLNFGGESEEITGWAVVLAEGWANPKWIDGELLRAKLEKANAELGLEFDFAEWAKRAGFVQKAQHQRARRRTT